MEVYRVIQWDSEDYAEPCMVEVLEVHMVGENNIRIAERHKTQRVEVHKVQKVNKLHKVQRVVVCIPWVHSHGVVKYL